MGLPVALTRGVARRALVLRKQSPHIFFAAGIVGTVGSTVLACRATLKLSETLEDIQKDLYTVKEAEKSLQEGHNSAPLTYNEEELLKVKVAIYIKGGLQITKLYAPSIVVGAASIALLASSHRELTRRNAALMAAYSAVQEAYNNYRERVRDQLGEERELEIYHAIDTNIVKGEKGVKTEIKSADPNRWSPYARMFDEYNKNWERDPELNRLFLQCQQNYYNQLLRIRGHVFLNEVYDALGFERSQPGAVVGWIIGDNGDNFIDFGIVEAYNSRFVNGDEPSIILDFNVDGVIYDKI